MSTQNLNIYQKLAKIGELVKVLKKDQKGYGYKYTSLEGILIRIQKKMAELEVTLYPGIVPGTAHFEPRDYTKKKIDKAGKPYEETVNDVIVEGQMVYTWVNNQNPEERIEVPWYFVGQQSDASQAYGSGMKYAERYFLKGYFNIADTEDDPEVLIKKQKEDEDKRERAVLEDLIAQIRSLLNEAIAADKDVTPKLQAIVTKHAGSKDFNKIKSTAVAAALLEELNREVVIK